MDAGYGARLESQRLLEIANKLLLASDLIGSKCFAERALESDPLLDGVDHILAIVDVLLASQRRINNNQKDYYSILQLPPPSSLLPIKRNYRHLSLLLNPTQNKLIYADAALRYVFEAYSFLSDPAKKSVYDSQIGENIPSVSVAQPPPLRLFWTSCPSCCHVFEYDRVYVDRTLRCRVCRKDFRAGEMAAAPPIVPGMDMYYCSWGFFPLGFPGSGFANCGVFGEGWKAFVPVSPKEKPLNAVPVNVAVGKPNVGSSVKKRNKKVVAKKRIGGGYEKKAQKIDLFGETDSDGEGVEIKGGAGGEGISNFEIDLEATEDLLSNLHDLPFV